jgi:hypothetical protein
MVLFSIFSTAALEEVEDAEASLSPSELVLLRRQQPHR